MIYTHLLDSKSEEQNTAAAATVEIAGKLAEDGWEKWDIIDGVQICCKRKWQCRNV